MMKIFLLFTFVVCMFQTTSAQYTANQLKQIDSSLNYLHKRGMFNGSIVIAEKGKSVYKKSLGTVSATSNSPINSSSSFNLASISKQFMAMMIMILKEQNKLNYDDAVTKYLPSFPYKNITIRNLLNHTSGISEYSDLSLKFRNTLDTIDRKDVLDLLVEHKPTLKFEPGSKWEYNNSAYVLVGNIIEASSGEELNAFFKKTITNPLHLDHTYMHYLNMPIKEEVHPDMVIGMARKNGAFIQDDLNRFDGTVGDGNIYSSADDLLKWEQSWYTSTLIKPTTLQDALTAVKLTDGTTYPYGFGWFIKETGNVFNHTGSWVGFRNLIERDTTNKKTLILLSSGGNELARKIITDIINNRKFDLPQTHLITNVKMVDGTGNPSILASVRIADDRIYEVGNLVQIKGETVTDGKGMILAPGFIDSHSHHYGDLKRNPEAIPTASQGITTIVIGQDGGSYPMDTLEHFFKQNPVAVNVATYTGHATLREEVMGEKNLFRTATDQEVMKMKLILKSEIEKGSLGLSTGLEYEEGFYSNRDEVLQLAETLAQGKGRYVSHIRSEDINLDEAIDEIIEIGKQANIPTQISHIKIAKKDRWNSSNELLQKLQKARAEGVNITADVYPYTFWNSTLRVLFPNRDYTNLASAEFAATQLFDPKESVLVEFAPIKEYAGKTISAIASMRKEKPAVTLMNLIQLASDFEEKNPEYKGRIEAIAAKSMSEEDVTNFINWPYANICSDGYKGGHPRGMGAFTRILARYVRERHVLALETAIFKMTALSAEHVGIQDRGIIGPGYYADLVLFDPKTVMDNATIQNPQAVSTGIEKVWVNGKLTFEKQKATGKLPGKLIKKSL
jgi:N-acyl-D-amino-acid deacylase